MARDHLGKKRKIEEKIELEKKEKMIGEKDEKKKRRRKERKRRKSR